MSVSRELYQELIIDHGRHPRNFCAMEEANHQKEGYNPLCGDRLTVYVLEREGVIENISFQGEGCAISMASASLMTQILKGKTLEEARRYFEGFHQLVMGKASEQELGKLMVLRGVSEYPARVKCASLSWHTVMAAIANDPNQVSTE